MLFIKHLSPFMNFFKRSAEKPAMKWLLFFPFALMMLFTISCSKRSGKPRVLVFGKTAGYYHTSIPTGIAAIQKLGSENDFLVDSTKDGSYFNEDSLKNYSAVIFLSTTLDVLNSDQQVAFERYIQSGGGM
jgi:cytochrome c